MTTDVANVAKFLAELTDALDAEGLSDGALRGGLLKAATPVVVEFVLTGGYDG